MSKSDDLSTPGEILMAALHNQFAHLESHECDECLQNHATILSASIEWVKAEAEKKPTVVQHIDASELFRRGK